MNLNAVLQIVESAVFIVLLKLFQLLASADHLLNTYYELALNLSVYYRFILLRFLRWVLGLVSYFKGWILRFNPEALALVNHSFVIYQ